MKITLKKTHCNSLYSDFRYGQSFNELYTKNELDSMNVTKNEDDGEG